MSFTSSLSTRGLVGGLALSSMVRSIGLVLGAGALAATYQLAVEEGRSVITNIRANTKNRHDRNAFVLLTLMNTDFPVELQDRIRRDRDAMRTGIAMLTDTVNPLIPEHALILRQTLSRLLGSEPSAA